MNIKNNEKKNCKVKNHRQIITRSQTYFIYKKHFQ